MLDVKCIVRQSDCDEFPRKMTIIKPSTKEEVVMAFDRFDKMCQFLYKKSDLNIRMSYDNVQRKYVALPNPPKIRMAWSLVNNEWQPIGAFKNKESPNQQFFTCFSSMWGHSIWFEGGAIRVNMNSFHRLVHMDENCLLYKMNGNYLFCQSDVEVVRVYDSKEESQTKENMMKVVQKAQNQPHIVWNKSYSR